MSGRVSGRLILVRHGQTHSNVARKLDTRPPGAALTEDGHRQAKSFAESVATPPAAVVSSVAVRARETAAYLSDYTGVELVVREGLHETDVGEFEDRSDDHAHDRFREVYRSWLRGEGSVRLPGGESGDEVIERFVPVLHDLRPRLDFGDVYVVSHGAAIRLVSQRLAEVDPDVAASNHLENTASVHLVPDGDRWRCERWGALTPPFDSIAVVDDPLG